MLLISRLLHIYALVIFVRALVSWIPVDQRHPAVLFLKRITDPVLDPIRKLIPPSRMGFDISPVIAIILFEVIARLII